MPMLNRSRGRLVVLLALSGVWTPGWTQGYGAFNNDTIYGTLQRDDRDSFDKAVTRVLRDPQDNKVVQWQGEGRSATSAAARIYANGARQQDGMPCRNLHAALTRGSAQENWNFWFCRRADGQWRVVSQHRQ